MTRTVAPPYDPTRTRRSLRVCTYVTQPFHAVVGQLTPADLVAAAAESFGDDGWSDPRADRPVVMSSGVATARVWWTPAGAEVGTRCWAAVSVLAVQGGGDPVTELLAEVPTTCAAGPAEAATAHRFLRGLEEALGEAVAA